MTFQEPHPTPRRAGAMTVAMRAAADARPCNALRVGIVRGGKILHDRVHSEVGVLSVGSAESNRFVITGENVPKTFPLFEIDTQGFILRFTPAMTGRVTVGNTALDLASLVRTGSATTHRGMFELRLSDRARGKISWGELSVLFDLVVGPPSATQPQLPQAVRASLSKSIDWMFTAFVLGSFLVHFGFVAYLEGADRPIEDVAEQVRGAQLIMEDWDVPPPPDPVPPTLSIPAREEGKVSSNDPTPKSRATTTPPSNRHDAKPRTADANSADAQAFAREARRQVENLMLGSSATGGRAFDDMLRDGAITSSAESLFAAVQGSGIASRASTGLLDTRQLSDGERTQSLGLLVLSGQATQTVTGGTPLEEGKIRGRIEPGQVEDEGGSGELDAAEVTREIKKRLGAIRSCYEHALRRDAGLSGKLTVAFTIEQSGSVSHVAMRDDSVGDAGLAQCVARAISSLRVRVPPRGGSIDFSYPFVFRGEP